MKNIRCTLKDKFVYVASSSLYPSLSRRPYCSYLINVKSKFNAISSLVYTLRFTIFIFAVLYLNMIKMFNLSFHKFGFYFADHNV